MMRTAREDEIALLLDWAAAEGWNPGLDDARAFFAADPGGFFVAERAGAPVAAISVVNHSADFAFLGLYLCLPAFRGQGIGYALWKHALEHAGPRTVGLDGVADQQANYARSGFVRTGSTTRLEGRLPAGDPSGIRDLGAGDLAAAAALDRAANGVERPAFLEAWLGESPTRTSVVLEGQGGIAGLATARACRAGCKIGPVVAPDLEAALALAAAAARRIGAEDAIIDVPEDQPEFRAALEDLGFVPTFATARMYRGAIPATSPALFAIATMELG